MALRLELDGCPNFRDFGGYPVADGRRVKLGCFYRSGHLADLSETDVASVKALGLSHIFDFRREFEQAHKPNNPELLGSVDQVVSLAITPGNQAGALDSLGETGLSPDAAHRFMCGINVELVRSHAPAFKRIFDVLLEQENPRVLVHCAAGKDRTGFAAAVILLALGVSREQVMGDYLATSRYFLPSEQIPYLKEKYGFEQVEDTALVPIVDARAEYLNAALDEMHAVSGAIEIYFESHYGLGARELDALRTRYTEVDSN